MYLINCFFVYSILGYIFEALVTLITKGSFSSGIFYGPITPVYGLGAIIILVVSKKLFKNLHLPRLVETIIVFFVVSILLSFIEWLGGILIEFIFDKSLWNYSEQKYNIGKYISLEMTLVWGIISILFIYVINPLLNKVIIKIPKWLTIILIILFIFDVIITLILKIKIF